MKKMHCRLRVLMAEKEVTQRDLVEALGMGSHTISKLYNNSFRRVDKDTVESLMNYFDCGISDLFIEKEVDADGR